MPNTAIYVAYAVSGPLKRVFIDALRHGFSTTYGFDDSQVRRRINVKGVVRQSGKPEKYDDFELKQYASSEELLKEYEKRYAYMSEGELFAVNKQQIEQSLKDNIDHFVLCNDPAVINHIVSDFSPNVRLLHITLRNYHTALKKLCEKYEDSYDERRQKIAELDHKLEESGIQYDVDLKIENHTQSSPLEQTIWEALDPLVSQI
jgi:hypothetical protein